MELLKPADPTKLGGITLRGRLGQGGMGTVYYGVLPDGEQVAVKMIRDDRMERSGVLDRFDREALAIGMVQSPRVANLVGASAPGEAPPWFAVEYVRGLTLAEYVIERGPLPADMGAALGIGLAEALAEIHRADILHRDLKPSNILLGADGPRVIDFGLAALTEAQGDLTRTSEIIGTPACMAPEQAHSARDLTRAVDVYSLGVVLLFAVTGHYPYQRPTAPAMLFAIADPATPPDLSGLPDALKDLVMDMLTKSPDERPSLDEVTAALTKALVDGGLGDPSTASRRLAGLTYVERDDDPNPPEPPRARPPRLPENPRVPSPLVQRIADTLRRDYGRDAGF